MAEILKRVISTTDQLRSFLFTGIEGHRRILEQCNGEDNRIHSITLVIRYENGIPKYLFFQPVIKSLDNRHSLG